MCRYLVPIVLFSFLAISCSYSGGGGDGGTNDGDAGRPDYDPSGSFLLTIPAGTQLCSGFSEGRTWQQELLMVGRIELAPGSHVLDREEGTSQTGGIVQRVEFGPDKKVAEPQTAVGSLEAVHQGQPPYDEWIYTFTVPTLLEGQESEADFKMIIHPVNNEWPAEISLDQDPLYWQASGEFRIAPATVQRFALCDLPDPPVREITATGANGDIIELVVRQGPYYESCLCAGRTNCYFLTRAEVKVGTYQATVEDRFRLVYNGSHHNWYDKYLILLDPPAEDVHAVLAIANGYSGQPDPKPAFIYLDSDLNELRREPNVDWQNTGQP